jgi:hypothetical protein
MKQLEFDLMDAAAHRTGANLQRDPQPLPLEAAPGDKEVEKHNLTHTPYAPWCPSCVCFKARADKQMKNDQVKVSSIPCISFDLAYTKSVAGSKDEQVGTMIALIYVDNQTGFIGCVRVKSKGLYHLMVQELAFFPQLLGYHEVTYRADNERNEPSARQLLKLVGGHSPQDEVSSNKGPHAAPPTHMATHLLKPAWAESEV